MTAERKITIPRKKIENVMQDREDRAAEVSAELKGLRAKRTSLKDNDQPVPETITNAIREALERQRKIQEETPLGDLTGAARKKLLRGVKGYKSITTWNDENGVHMRLNFHEGAEQ